MTNWKFADTTNSVAFRTLDSGGMESCLASTLPADTVIEPADIPDPKIAIRAQIASLEQAQLMPRATREFMLLFVETNNLTAMPGYAPLKALDDEIVALRNQL